MSIRDKYVERLSKLDGRLLLIGVNLRIHNGVAEEQIERFEKISQRLILIESQNPGIVRMKANPALVPESVAALKELGFQKKFLTSGEQFIYDCFLSYQMAAHILLPFSLLIGPEESLGQNSCWDGFGCYMGSLGFLLLTDFSSDKRKRLALSVRCDPFFEQISDLLDPIEKSKI